MGKSNAVRINANENENIESYRNMDVDKASNGRYREEINHRITKAETAT